MLSVEQLDDAISPTWPAKITNDDGRVVVRIGGGGQRATATTIQAAFTEQDISDGEAAMANREEFLFRVRPWETELAEFLDARGYLARDPTNMLAMPIEELAQQDLKPVSAFHIWPPLGIMNDLWGQLDVATDRRENMHRVVGPKVGLLGRGSDQPGGVGFVAIHNEVAMVHAVAVSPHLRRQKIAQNMMIAGAKWAADLGAKWLCTLCTEENESANSLYQKLGMRVLGQYHYRAKLNPNL